MVIEAFPPVTEADEHGLLAVGGDLEIPSLLLAYSQGIFPWPISATTLAWFSPPERAVLFTDEFHCSQSLKRAMRKSNFSLSINQDFSGVIGKCAESKNRRGQRGTWITKDMRRAYINLHEAGFAHSFECYDQSELVGGVYGVSLGGIFAAESMFYRKSDASKMALLFLVKYLEKQGVTWIDAQVQNPFLQSLGFKEITRDRYMKLLSEGETRPTLSFPAPRNTDELLPVKTLALQF